MSNAVPKPFSRWALTSLAAASLLGSAGCAATPTPAPGAEGGSGETSSPATDGAEAAAFADGTYTATGSYQTPGGEESIEVTVTLESGAVADVSTEPMPSNPTTEQYQGKFSSGIKDEIVGTPIDELNVSKVSGSSLTSGGFKEAIDQIKGEAAQ
ncbi:hypothetical protein GCM10027403_05100 [Arthrobacter tecti]